MLKPTTHKNDEAFCYIHPATNQRNSPYFSYTATMKTLCLFAPVRGLWLAGQHSQQVSRPQEILNLTKNPKRYANTNNTQTNEIPHNLAILLPQISCLFAPVPNILTVQEDSMAMTGHQQHRVFSQNIQKVQVLPSHNGDILLPRIYPINSNGIIQVIVLRIRSGDEIWRA